MQRILTGNLWTEIRVFARKAQRRKAAIAYITRDLVGFRRGDVLIVDASKQAVSCGETDARLLRDLWKKGVQLFHCDDLHAKVLLLDHVAFVGSANMSNSSAVRMVEAGVLTDHSSTVSSVASFIEQLIQLSSVLSERRLAILCKVKVIRRGGNNSGRRTKRKIKIPPLGNDTWLVGLREAAKDPSPSEQSLIDQAVSSLQKQLRSADAEFDLIKWGSRSRFPRKCRAGDSIIQIWRSNKAKRPSAVYRAVPVLLKQKSGNWTRFYISEPTGRHAKVRWGSFQRLLNELGYPRQVSANSVHLIKPDMASKIERRWKSADRT
jgi:hypothetical protein